MIVTIEAVTNIVDVGPTTTAIPVLVGVEEVMEGVAAGERELEVDVDGARDVSPDTVDEELGRDEVEESVDEEIEEDAETEGVVLDTGVEEEAGGVTAFIWTSTLDR